MAKMKKLTKTFDKKRGPKPGQKRKQKEFKERKPRHGIRNKMDLAGHIFGDVIVIQKFDTKHKQSRWQCMCRYCGKEYLIYTSNLHNEYRCGCARGADVPDFCLRKAAQSLIFLKMDEDPYRNLASAIVVLAADDFRIALEKKDSKLKASIMEFFKSEWFMLLTNVDPNYLVERLQKDFDALKKHGRKRRQIPSATVENRDPVGDSV